MRLGAYKVREGTKTFIQTELVHDRSSQSSGHAELGLCKTQEEATPEMGGTCDIHQSMHLIREVAVTETEGDLLVWMGLSRLVAFQNPGGLSLWLKKDQ